MLRSLREGIRQIPHLVQQPRIALRWILGAHVAQACLVGWVLLLTLALPKFLDPVLDEMYPPLHTRKKILEPAPLVLAFVLGPMLENNLSKALIMARGDAVPFFFSRPIAATLLTLAILVLIYPMIRWLIRRVASGGQATASA